MCPFGVTLCENLLADHWDCGGPEDEEKIRNWLEKMEKDEGNPEIQQRRTLTSMSMALVTSSNALLGRAPKPRSIQGVSTAVDSYLETLELELTERTILHEVKTNIAKLQELGRPVQSMVGQLRHWIALSQKPSDVVIQADMTQAASQLGWSFFSFAKLECARRGSGMQGLIQACGIVIGQVKLEEVVFG